MSRLSNIVLFIDSKFDVSRSIFSLSSKWKMKKKRCDEIELFYRSKFVKFRTLKNKLKMRRKILKNSMKNKILHYRISIWATMIDEWNWKKIWNRLKLVKSAWCWSLTWFFYLLARIKTSRRTISTKTWTNHKSIQHSKRIRRHRSTFSWMARCSSIFNRCESNDSVKYRKDRRIDQTISSEFSFQN